MLVISALRRERQVGPWGSGAGQLNLLHDFRPGETLTQIQGVGLERCLVSCTDLMLAKDKNA